MFHGISLETQILIESRSLESFGPDPGPTERLQVGQEQRRNSQAANWMVLSFSSWSSMTPFRTRICDQHHRCWKLRSVSFLTYQGQKNQRRAARTAGRFAWRRYRVYLPSTSRTCPRAVRVSRISSTRVRLARRKRLAMASEESISLARSASFTPRT